MYTVNINIKSIYIYIYNLWIFLLGGNHWSSHVLSKWQSHGLFRCVCAWVYLSIYLPTRLLFNLPIHLITHLPIYVHDLPTHLPPCLYMFTSRPSYLFSLFSLSINLSLILSIYLSTYLSIYLSIYLAYPSKNLPKWLAPEWIILWFAGPRFLSANFCLNRTPPGVQDFRNRETRRFDVGQSNITINLVIRLVW